MPTFGQNLTAHKDTYIKGVNDEVGRARLVHITDLPGQEVIYEEKYREAQAYLAEQPTTLDDYPYIKDAVGIDAPTAYEVAQLWVNLNALWKQAGLTLEKIRRSYIVQIEEQTSRVGVDQVYASFIAELMNHTPT